LKIKLTNEELEVLVKEVSERIRDIAFMCLEDKIRAAIEKIALDTTKDEELTFTWKISMRRADLIQILGRVRRKKRVHNM